MDRQLTTPIAADDIRSLSVGDIVYLDGDMFTARDDAHARMLELGSPFDTEGLALFHCGPLVRHDGEGWRVVAAGPTTSARLEMFEPETIGRFKPRLIVGKGGMGPGTLAALAEEGAVYCHFTGGAGALAAAAIDHVKAVHWLDELGMPEAVWVFAVRRFGPLLVTMDSHGRSLYNEVAAVIEDNMEAIRDRIARS